MRSEAKLNFIERRSMNFYARSDDFYRILSEEFLEVPWSSREVRISCGGVHRGQDQQGPEDRRGH
eukprot:10277287-Heterocapsa_arctica.AAC.1